MKSLFRLTFIIVLSAAPVALASYKVQVILTPMGEKVIAAQKSKKETFRGERKLIRSLPYALREDAPPSREIFQEYLVDDSVMTQELLAFSRRSKDSAAWPGAEVKTLVMQGPTENRINLTIVGDGYTLSEKDKFFADAKRTTENLFKGSTFASYLPLFNVFAVFVPSNQSGIGDGMPNDTALKLYRDPKGSKRAIMPGDSGAAERAVALAPATDYPILLANDNYYGGLGGRFAISTSSVRSGMIVLRHELGHNFGNVGEEYDGGYVYAGANNFSSPQVPWGYWADGSSAPLMEALDLGGDYYWQNLANRPITMNFKFPKAGPKGPYRLHMLISSVGWETPDDVIATLDGQRIPLRGTFNDDRNFYELGPVNNFPAGAHAIRFQENVQDGDNVLAYVRAYAMAPDYDFSENRIGAYMTYDISGRRTYRPTHDSCLMRNMLRPNFCVVDIENMWHRFLDRTSLIDDVNVSASTPDTRTVSLKTVPLKGLTIGWFRVNGNQETEVSELRNQLSWSAPNGLTGKFRVRVKFETPEVRRYDARFMAAKDLSL